jgi:chromatin remodeling complex protein RSC6
MFLKKSFKGRRAARYFGQFDEHPWLLVTFLLNFCHTKPLKSRFKKSSKNQHYISAGYGHAQALDFLSARRTKAHTAIANLCNFLFLLSESSEEAISFIYEYIKVAPTYDQTLRSLPRLKSLFSILNATYNDNQEKFLRRLH